MGYFHEINGTVSFPPPTADRSDPVAEAVRRLNAARLMHPWRDSDDPDEALTEALKGAELVRDESGGVTITINGSWKLSAFWEMVDELATAGASGSYEYVGEDGTDSGTTQFESSAKES